MFWTLNKILAWFEMKLAISTRTGTVVIVSYALPFLCFAHFLMKHWSVFWKKSIKTLRFLHIRGNLSPIPFSLECLCVMLLSCFSDLMLMISETILSSAHGFFYIVVKISWNKNIMKSWISRKHKKSMIQKFVHFKDMKNPLNTGGDIDRVIKRPCLISNDVNIL